MRTKTSVLISASNKMHCDLLRKAFHSVRSRFQITALASSAVEVLSALENHRPQVAVLSSDLQDGPLSGIWTLPKLHTMYPETKILLVAGSPDEELIVDAFRFGAVGVFNQDGPFDLLCKAIEVVSAGQVWANTEELHYVLRALTKCIKPPKLDPAVENRVTIRELAVVRLAIEGLSNREIARRLALTEHTVKNYLFRVFDKLGVSNRVELVLLCLHTEKNSREELGAEKAPSPRKILSLRKSVTFGAAG